MATPLYGNYGPSPSISFLPAFDLQVRPCLRSLRVARLGRAHALFWDVSDEDAIPANDLWCVLGYTIRQKENPCFRCDWPLGCWYTDAPPESFRHSTRVGGRFGQRLWCPRTHHARIYASHNREYALSVLHVHIMGGCTHNDEDTRIVESSTMSCSLQDTSTSWKENTRKLKDTIF